jgi:hypothetical protein
MGVIKKSSNHIRSVLRGFGVYVKDRLWEASNPCVEFDLPPGVLEGTAGAGAYDASSHDGPGSGYAAGERLLDICDEGLGLVEDALRGKRAK